MKSGKGQRYAYLHAVASRAGMACVIGNRPEDNNGIDAKLTAWGPFSGSAYLKEIDIKVQLKATKGKPVEDEQHFSFFLKGITQYDDLREEALSTPRILVVLFLPDNDKEWLSISAHELSMRRCAYWVSLRGAPESSNKTGVTIQIPKSHAFTCESLSELASSMAKREIPTYGGHE